MDLTDYEIIAVSAAVIASYVKNKVDYSKLEAKVVSIENDTHDFKKDLRTLLDAVQEIKVLLAKNQVQ